MSIFSQTTCLKSEILTKMIELMTAAGWTDISSNATTDFFVMNSKGENNDKNLVFQIRSTSTTNANDVHSTTAVPMSYRLIGGYTPAETPDTAGVFDRPNETWRLMSIASSTVVDPAVELTLWYSVNRDRAIFNIYTPESLNMLPVLIYIGLPTVYTSEPNSRGLVVMTSYASSFSNSVHVTDNVPELPSLSASTTIPNNITLAPRSPNSAGIHTPSELQYANNAIGIRGKLDSILFLPNNSISDGDILKMGAKRYRATQLGTSGNNSYPSNCVVYQIS